MISSVITYKVYRLNGQENSAEFLYSFILSPPCPAAKRSAFPTHPLF
jgi:hypothetical protein